MTISGSRNVYSLPAEYSIRLSERGYVNRYDSKANRVHRFVNVGEFSRCGQVSRYDTFTMGEAAEWHLGQTCRECFWEAPA
jgi:hypothetical protein